MYNWLSYYGNGYDAQQWTREQRAQNVDIIASYFYDKGWTINALASMIGNMEGESYINPGQWQHSYPVESPSQYCGYGLVQWTPWWEKIGPWTNNHLTDYDKQLTRINWELENEDVLGADSQWQKRNGYTESFYDFSRSTNDTDYLTSCFFWCYENGTASTIPARQQNSRYWYQYLIDNPPGPIPPPPTPTQGNKMPLYFYLKPHWKRGY